MKITKSFSPFLVLEQNSISEALSKMSANKAGFVFVTDENYRVTGCLSDGDFCRWVTQQSGAPLNQSVRAPMNRNFASASASQSSEEIQHLLDSRIRFLPLLDSAGRIVAIAHRDNPVVRIGNFEIGKRSPCLIIAEIGNNHNGDIKSAKHLVDLAIKAGADCTKFQMRFMDQLHRNEGKANDPSEDLGSQYVLDQLSKFQLTPDEYAEVFDYCLDSGVLPMCTPWDMKSLEFLDRWGMTAYKIASADLVNHDLLAATAQTGKPMVVSTGMSTETEIRDAVRILDNNAASYVLLHCNSAYPAPYKDVNLQYMSRLAEIGNCEVGYSGHERGYHIPVAAVAMGARVVEKHFTDDRSKEGNDHRVSLLPDEFATMVRYIRDLETSMGFGVRTLSQGEVMNREILGKSVVAAKPIKKGARIETDMLAVRSPGTGLSPYMRGRLVGLSAKRDMATFDTFFPSDLDSEVPSLRNYKFHRPWGLPVRHHDYKRLLKETNADLLEFHLSFKDLELNLADFFDEEMDLGLVVHSPEVFANDFLLDLASPVAETQRKSIEALQSVVNLTRSIKRYFRNDENPPIILNAGGFTRDGFVSRAEQSVLYDRIAESLSRVDAEGVEIIPQTMPPFPWLFGGQLYHNLFLDAEGINAFCRKTGMRICLDVSHSKLTCNKFGFSFKEFMEAVGPYTRHIHLVDARGVDGEGLQIGEGEIDFGQVAAVLNETAPKASFIPEIWQGHKNMGEGFAIALDRLEKWF